MISQHLFGKLIGNSSKQTSGFICGDFNAHNSLWNSFNFISSGSSKKHVLIFIQFMTTTFSLIFSLRKGYLRIQKITLIQLLILHLQSSISVINSWLKNHAFHFNSAKSKIMMFMQ